MIAGAGDDGLGHVEFAADRLLTACVGARRVCFVADRLGDGLRALYASILDEPVPSILETLLGDLK
ncbi:MAG TPA: NepR family anti-sigma factor [Allosphingosinicella sp.]|jgi:hypothetical protein